MSAAAGLIPAVVIGGVTYTLVKQDEGSTPVGGATKYTTSGAMTTSQLMGGLKTAAPPAVTSMPLTGSMSFGARFRATMGIVPTIAKTNWTWPDNPANIDPELAKKMAELEKYAEQQYNNMDDVSRAAAADKLNKELKLDPPLNGSEDWKTIAAVAGGAAGAAAGAALCGPICGKVGAMCGAYLGVKIEEALAKNWDEMKAWCTAKWGDLKEEISDAYNEIKDAAGDALDFINPF